MLAGMEKRFRLDIRDGRYSYSYTDRNHVEKSIYHDIIGGVPDDIIKYSYKGAMTGFVYANAPQNIFYSWVEVFYLGSWYELEAFILDMEYLTKLQKINSECTGSFCGYGVAVSDFQNPVIEWNGNHTYIQSEGINQDFGVYNSPDELLVEHHQEMSAFKNFLFRYMGKHLMNRNVARIRNSRV